MMLSSSGDALAEGKVLILYILSKIGKPVTNEALLKVVSTLTEMNYFYFQQFLLDLLEEKYIIHYQKENSEPVYEITKDGSETLKLVQDIIPGIAKLRIDNNLKENIDQVEEELSITADYIPHNENDYSVKCKIVENNTILFEIETFAGSREQAKKIADNWKENATEIYPQILDILTK